MFPAEVIFQEADVANSLLKSMSNDIGQIATLHARLHGLKKIYFAGYFIRGHPMTMHTISFAVNYWSKVSDDNTDVRMIMIKANIGKASEHVHPFVTTI